MIEFHQVSFSYDTGIPVLHNINFHVKRGECVGLIGANGAGKSTILRMIPGLLSGTGEILAGGLPVCRENLPAIRQKTGFVLQDSDNQMFMPTVYEDMMFSPRSYGMTKEEADERIDRILADMDLMKLKNRYNHKISGGEKRMAAIAVILTMNPDIILMDEPSTALDPANRRKIINIIKKLDQTVLIASHDLDMILETCSRVILLSGGQIAADGTKKEILFNRNLLEANHLELPFCLAGIPDGI